MSDRLKPDETVDDDLQVGIRAGRRTAAGVVAFTLALASPASGRPIRPASTTAADVATVRAELSALLRDFERTALAADEAARTWMDLRLREIEVRAVEQESSRAFEERVRSAYIAGPGRAIEMVLGARDLHELAAVLPYAAGAIEEQRLDVRELVARRDELEAVSRHTAEAQARLIRSEERLTRVRARIEARLAQAEAAQPRAGRELRAQYRGTVDRVAGATRTIRYRKGEAMFKAAEPYLGPRTDCSIPKGLRSTGDAISGEASWYGNAFRGKPTASGAIFYPERYTVAHRTLPFGLFLLIKMGDRCVVSFLNDRGPYVDGRILDLSYASAQAIGLTGAKDVSATLLVRAD